MDYIVTEVLVPLTDLEAMLVALDDGHPQVTRELIEEYIDLCQENIEDAE